MNHSLKIIVLLFIYFIFSSCNQKLEQDYPKTISYSDGLWSTGSIYEKNIDNFEDYPDSIQELINNYLIKEIGLPNFKKSMFNYGYIASNTIINDIDEVDKTIASLLDQDSKRIEELETKYSYPVYGVGFRFSDIKKGIEKYDLTFMMDSKGEILKTIMIPKNNDLKPERLNFIALDSIHKILSERKVSSNKLILELRFDSKRQSLFYYASTLISKGSILGPSCLPEYQNHFKVNAISGEIVAFETNNYEEY